MVLKIDPSSYTKPAMKEAVALFYGYSLRALKKGRMWPSPVSCRTLGARTRLPDLGQPSSSQPSIASSSITPAQVPSASRTRLTSCYETAKMTRQMLTLRTNATVGDSIGSSGCLSCGYRCILHMKRKFGQAQTRIRSI